MERLQRLQPRSAVANVCSYCVALFSEESRMRGVGRGEREADFELVAAIYSFASTAALVVGGVKAQRQLIDDIYHLISDVTDVVDREAAVEEFLGSYGYRTEDLWFSHWMKVASYLCYILKKECRAEHEPATS